MSFRERIKNRLSRLKQRFGIGEREKTATSKYGKEIPSVERAEELSKEKQSTSIVIPEEMWNKFKYYCTEKGYTLSDVMTLAVMYMVRYGPWLEDVVDDWDREVKSYGVWQLFEKR